MDSTSTDILVILLSVSMSVVLLMTIIALAYAIKILRSLKSISDKAEHIVDNVENASEFIKKAAGPVTFTKLVSNVIEMVKSKGEEEKKK